MNESDAVLWAKSMRDVNGYLVDELIKKEEEIKELRRVLNGCARDSEGVK